MKIKDILSEMPQGPQFRALHKAWQDTQRTPDTSRVFMGHTIVFTDREIQVYKGADLVAAKPRNPGPVTNITVSQGKTMVHHLLRKQGLITKD